MNKDPDPYQLFHMLEFYNYTRCDKRVSVSLDELITQNRHKAETRKSYGCLDMANNNLTNNIYEARSKIFLRKYET